MRRHTRDENVFTRPFHATWSNPTPDAHVHVGTSVAIRYPAAIARVATAVFIAKTAETSNQDESAFALLTMFWRSTRLERATPRA
jgi:hypothetical protein